MKKALTVLLVLIGSFIYGQDRDFLINKGTIVTMKAYDSTGIANTATKLYGRIYNKNTWSDLSEFTNNGSTSSVVSNKISFSGGAGTYTQTLDLNGYTCLEKWKMTAKVKVGSINATSYGFGLGIRSANSNGLSNSMGTFNMATGGSGNFYNITGTSNTVVSTSSTVFSFSVNDYLLFSVERDVDSIVTSVFNYTTKGPILRTAYRFTTASPFIHNTGRFAIYSLGGSFTIDSLSIESNEVKNAQLMLVGDSKTQMYTPTNSYNRYGYLLGRIFTPTVISAGGFDRTNEVVNRLTEIIALAPKNVLLSIGSNDMRSAVDSNTMKTNYNTIVTTLAAAGIKVYHTNLFYETSISQAVLKNYIERTFSVDSVIKTYDDGAVYPSVLDADNIHPNDFGNRVIYNTIVASRKFTNGSRIFDYLPVASSTTRGVLSYADWTTFNAKAPTTTPTFTTNITTPLIIGGTSTTQTLIYKTTTGVGATGADHIFQVGTNGATEVARITNAGNVGIGLTPTTDKLEVAGNLSLTTAGNKIKITTGTNGSAGNATLVGGTVTVSCNIVTANSLIMLTRKTSGGTIGTAITYTLSAGASFTINSDNPLDTSTFTYLIIN